MIPVCSEHAALLKTLAKSPKSSDAVLAYSDWLQDFGSPGWLIVGSYKITDWPVWMGGATGWHQKRWGRACEENWKLPWLDGVVHFDKWVQNPWHRIKFILLGYAEGKVLE